MNIFRIAIAITFLSVIGAVTFADIPLQKQHKKEQREGEKINCVYCHEKGGIPKKGKNYTPYKTTASCKGNGCH